MTLTRFLCHAGIVAAAAALLVSGIGTGPLHAQNAGSSAANVDGAPAKKAVKKTTAKPSAEKPQKPARSAGSGAIQGYRPDPLTTY